MYSLRNKVQLIGFVQPENSVRGSVFLRELGLWGGGGGGGGPYSLRVP